MKTTEDGILESTYVYRKNHFEQTEEGLRVTPKEHAYHFKTHLKPRKTGNDIILKKAANAAGSLGVLLVGIGGNNGSTAVGSIFANRKNMSWRTKDGVQTANYFG